MASIYFFPADLSDEAISCNSNQGWFASATTNSCPTAPVDPISATFKILQQLNK